MLVIEVKRNFLLVMAGWEQCWRGEGGPQLQFISRIELDMVNCVGDRSEAKPSFRDGLMRTECVCVVRVCFGGVVRVLGPLVWISKGGAYLMLTGYSETPNSCNYAQLTTLPLPLRPPQRTPSLPSEIPTKTLRTHQYKYKPEGPHFISKSISQNISLSI